MTGVGGAERSSMCSTCRFSRLDMERRFDSGHPGNVVVRTARRLRQERYSRNDEGGFHAGTRHEQEGAGARHRAQAIATLRTVLQSIRVAAYRIPTNAPESDGTLEWDSTTLVVVHAAAGGTRGIGYTYADRSTAALIQDRL